MSIEYLESSFFSKPDLPDGIKAQIRGLKSEGKNVEAEHVYQKELRKAITKRVRSVLDSLKRSGYDVDSMSTESLDTLLEWQNVRQAYKRHEITILEFDQLRQEFKNRHESNFDDERVISGLEFISQRTSRS